MSEILQLQPYSWEEFDEVTDDDSLAIYCWALDRQSIPHLVRFETYPASCVIELPRFIGTHYFSWSPGSTRDIMKRISNSLKDDAPIEYRYAQKSPLYYYRGAEYYIPTVECYFKSIRARDHCRNLLNKPYAIDPTNPQGSSVQLRVWETNISCVRKLLTDRNCRYAQWFSIEATPATYKITLESTREYLADWKNLTPTDPEITKTWFTHPKVLMYDIECYSDKHKAMPKMFNAKHVAYMISGVIKRIGDPHSVIKKFCVIYGDCSHIPEDKTIGIDELIVTNSESQMINIFGEKVVEYDPVILSGYNIFSFDNAYLDARLQRLICRWPNMSRLISYDTKMSSKEWNSGAYGHNSINIIQMPGRISLDMFPLIKRDYKLNIYTLEAVSRSFLGKGKHPIKPKEMFVILERVVEAKKNYTDLLKIGNYDDLIFYFRVMNTPSDYDYDNDSTLTEPQKQVFHQWKHVLEHECKTQDLLNDILPSDLTNIILSYDIKCVTDNFELILSDKNVFKIVNELYQAMREMRKVAEYCVQDSILPLELFEKLNIWISLIELSNIVGLNIQDLYTRGQQQRCLSQLYDEAHHRGYVITMRTTPSYGFSGGFVYESKPGLHENIITLDFASLYPSVIIAYNISWETLVPPEMFDIIPDEECNIIEFEQEEEVNQKEDDSDDEDGKVDTEDSKKVTKKDPEKKKVSYRFKWRKSPQGLLPAIEQKLIGGRNRVKAMIKTEKNEFVKIVLDKRQNSLKVSANSFFGFLGVRNGGGLAPLLEGAMSITAKGRELIGIVNNHIKTKYSGEIVAGDSVTGDTPILIRLPSGDIGYYRIDELIELTDSDIQPDGKHRRDISELGYSVWTDKGWTKIKLFIGHRTNKRMYRVLTHTGCVDVTEDHSLLNSLGEKVKPGELKVGMSLLHKDLPMRGFREYTMDKEFALGLGFFYAEGTCGKSLDEIIFGYRSLFYDKDGNKRIPHFIMNGTNQVKQWFFDGYYSGNDSFTERTVCFDNKGKIGTAGLNFLASSLGYKFSIGIKEDGESDIYRCNLAQIDYNKEPDVIKKIIDLGPCPGEFVYDLETENHHFGAGIGRLIVSNTDSTFIDLNLKDQKTVNEWGDRLSKEISGTPEVLFQKEQVDEKGIVTKALVEHKPAVPGLFPPPLKMEFEKGGRVLIFKKKKYVFIPLDKNGDLQFADDKIIMKGVLNARRDNCQWVRSCFKNLLMCIVKREPITHGITIIVNSVIEMNTRKVPYELLVIVRELGKNYKSKSYFMNIFSEEIRKDGKIANPGDRLEYIIVEDERKLLGQKMRLIETFLERKGTPSEEKINSMYYLEKALMKPIDQLWSIGYSKELAAIGDTIRFKPNNRCAFTTIKEPVKMMFRMIGINRDVSFLKDLFLSEEEKSAKLALIPPPQSIIFIKKKEPVVDVDPTKLIFNRPTLPLGPLSVQQRTKYKDVIKANVKASENANANEKAKTTPNITFTIKKRENTLVTLR